MENEDAINEELAKQKPTRRDAVLMLCNNALYGRKFDSDGQPMRDVLDALVADAQRFAGLRAILCEPDTHKRDRMFEVFDQVIPPDHDGDITAEQVNAVFDLLLSAADQVRNDA